MKDGIRIADEAVAEVGEMQLSLANHEAMSVKRKCNELEQPPIILLAVYHLVQLFIKYLPGVVLLFWIVGDLKSRGNECFDVFEWLPSKFGEQVF